MSKALDVFNIIKEITSKDYMRLSCYNNLIAIELIENDMRAFKKSMKEWLDEQS